MRRAVGGLVVALLLLTPGTATAADGEPCSQDASVTWRTDDQVVSAATVSVPGCPDGERVGLQVLTDDGDVPAEMLFRPVAGGRAVFDLTAFDLRIEPTTGVRVGLYAGDTVVPDPDVDVLPDGEERPPGEPGGSDGDGDGDGGDDDTSVLPGADERGRPAGRLPFTGAALEVLLGLGLGLTVAGSSLVARRRRERRAATQG